MQNKAAFLQHAELLKEHLFFGSGFPETAGHPSAAEEGVFPSFSFNPELNDQHTDLSRCRRMDHLTSSPFKKQNPTLCFTGPKMCVASRGSSEPRGACWNRRIMKMKKNSFLFFLKKAC